LYKLTSASESVLITCAERRLKQKNKNKKTLFFSFMVK
jgi:hypothetical protein